MDFKDFKEKIIGKVVKSYRSPNPNDDGIIVTFNDGTKATFHLEAGCCSNSYFTDPTQFDELKGATILDVEDRYGHEVEVDLDNLYAQWSFLVFTTNKGHVTIDWRNDSNGYYSGTLVCSFQE